MTDHDRTAGTTAASHPADEHPRHPSHGGRAWFRSWFAPSAGARCGLRGVLPALFAFLLLLGLSTGVQAQTEQVLISNIDQSGAVYNSSSGEHRAQAFTTGNEANGYTLTSVDVAYWSLNATSNLSVTIRSVNNGGNPGATLGTLNNPAHSGLNGRGVLTHEAPGAGIALAANTTYFVVWAPFGGSTVGHSSVSSDAEDAGGASGWSIANGQKFGSNGTSWGDYGNSIQIRLNGTVTVTSSGGGVTVSPTSLALTERGMTAADRRKTYTVVLDTDPGVDVTITATNGDGSAVALDTDPVTSDFQSAMTFTAGGDGSGSGAGNGNWAVPQTVTVESRIDGDAANESFSITHTATAASGPYNGITVAPVAVTTTDAGHGVIVTDSSLSVAENDETDVYWVELKSAPSGNVTVSATSAATGTATVSPASVTFGTSDWDTPREFTVTGKGAGSTTISHAVQSSADTTNYPTSTTIPPVSVTVTAAPNARLTLSPTEIPSGSLDGATITLVPKESTFKSGGGGGGGNLSDFHPDDVDSQGLKNPNGEARLSASGLAKITLSGAPSGLTIASGKLLAREQPHSHGGGTKGHRSAEITLAYSGSAITADDPVTVNVRGGSGQGLLRWGTENDGSFPPNLSAGFTVKAAVGGVTVSPTSLALTELGSSSAVEKTYTVVLDTDPTADVTITATSGDATAAEVDTDSGTSGNQSTLTFTAGGDGSGSGAGNGNWAVAQTVTVRAKNDGDGANESFSITHAATAASGPYNAIMIDPVAVTTTDAGHGVVVSESSLSVAENDGMASYGVVLKSQPSGNVVVSVTSGATATAVVTPGTLTFTPSGTNAWNVGKTVTVTGKGAGSTAISHAVQSSADTTNYPTSTTIPGVSVTVTAAANPRLTLSPTQIQAASLSGATITLVPNDATFFAAGGQGTEDGGQEGGRARTYVDSRDLVSGRIPNTAVRLSSTGLGLITLSGAPAGLTIASGRLLARQTGTQSTHGVDRHRSVEITLAYNGAAITADDPVTVNVNRDLLRSGVSDGPLGSDLSADFTVKAAAGGVTVSPTSLALTELGSSSTIEKTYTVVLDTDPGADVTITATSGDATAVEVDTDAGTTGNQSTLTFTAGGDGSGSGVGNGNWAVAQTVTVRALNDGDAAGESFSITHAATAAGSAAPYHGIAIDPVAVTLTDAGHGVVVSKSSLSVAANDETDTYTVVLKSQPSGNVTVSATSGATARATVSPGTLSFTNLDWNTPKTFTVTGKGAGSTSISHAVSTGTTDYPTTLTIPAVSVTVTADSRQVLDLSFSSNSNNEGVSATLTVTATGGSGSPAVAGGTALLTFSGDGIASSDYSVTAASSLVLFGGPPPSINIGIDLASDNVDEPNETLVVGLQNLPSGYRAGTTASVTIIDRNPTTVTLAGGGTVTEDGANSADVTVTLSRNLVAGETVTVPLAITGTGIAAGDYTIAPAPGSSLNRGVTLNTSNPHSAAQPAVVFTGHGTNTVQVATLRVTAVQDSTDEGASEALAVGFGSGNRAVMSNLDRASGTGTTGTTTAGTATVTITDDDTADTTVPRISSIVRQTPSTSPTNADSLTWRVTFNEAVQNVDTADFEIASNGNPSLWALVTQATRVGNTNAYDVTVSGDAPELAGSGNLDVFNGTVTLVFANDQDIQDTSGNALTSTTPTGTNHNTFVVDNTAPRVTSITRQTPSSSPTDADSLTWRVTFNEAVQNVNVADFQASGTTAGLAVAQVGATNAYDVTASGGNLAGLTATVTLSFASGQDIEDSSGNLLTDTAPTGTNNNTFVVNNTSAVPEISMELQTGETSNRNTAGQLELVESGGTDGAVFNLSANSVLVSTLTVCLQVTETGGDLVAAAAEGIRTATLTSSGNTNGAGIYTLTWSGDTADERNSVVTATLLAPETVGCSAANGSYTVSSAMASDAVFIEDDDATTVELTSSDTSMAEGDASNTATLTFTLGRRLHAGEVLVVPFTLATSTGARLPGNATPDFAVTAAGTGVTIARPNTATPSVTFTGHGTSTVQVATVTLTPVANRDDGDTAREEITATLATDSVLGSTAGSGTTVGGGAMRHGTDFAVGLTLEDDDAPVGASELTLTLSSASAPEGSGGTRDVTVTVAKPAGSARVSYRLCFSGTATLDEDGERSAGEDYRVIKFNGGQQTVFHGGHLSLFHTTGGARCVGGGSVTFLAGVDSHAWRVRVFGDAVKESDETVVVTLSGSGTPLPDGWSISPAGNPATHTIVNDDAPHVTLHAVDPVAVEGSSTDTAAIEVRLSHALEAGETLTVNLDTNTYIWGTSSLDGSPAGVAYSRPGAREHRLVFTGPSAPDRARIVLEASANSVSGDGLQSRDHYVELIDLDGYPGATLDSRQASRQFLQVVDSASAAGHGVTLSVHSWPDGSMREIGEGGKAVLKVSTAGGRPVQVTVAVQPVTADFADLGRASEGGYGGGPANATGWVAWQERDGHQGLDLYSVTAFEQPAPSVYMQIPVVDDGQAEGPETFRAFIYRTPPGYKAGGGLAGTRVSTVEFTIPANDGGLPRNAPAVQVPAAQVANLKVTRVDASTASARWDAVAHATGYEVEWDALDGNGQSIAGGLHAGVTATTQTIEHQAPGAASLRVTVAPEHVDGNGDTQVLSDLAATAVLDLSTPQSAQADSLQAGAASCDLTSVKADVNRYILETQYGAAHVARWKKALAGLNGEVGGMTAAGARQMKAAYSPGRWDPVVVALDCLEATATPQAETPAAVPELGLSAGPAVDEGGSAVFTVHADPAPAAELTVAFTVAQTGEYLSAPGAGSRTVTLAAGAASATLAIATADDGVDEADGSVSVTLDAGAGYAIAEGKAAGTVAVRDNDEPVISIAGGSGVTEGAPASFTLTANPAPHAALTVSLAVTQSGDFAAEGQTGAREVTVPTGGSATFEVATTDDNKDEPDGSVTATVAAGTGYAVAASPDDSASVAVADDDAAPAAPALAVADATANEGDGFMWFTVTLSPASDRAVSVDYRTRESNPVSARTNSDYLQVDFGDVTFSPGETSKRFWVYVFDDSHDEGPETFEVALSAPTGGAVIADGVAVGTIVNDDPMPAAFLARFGRTVAEQALDGIAARIAAPRDPGFEGSFAGHVDLGSLAARGDAGTGEDSVRDAATALEEDGQGIAQAAPDGGHGIGHVPPDGHGPALAFLADGGGGSGSGGAAPALRSGEDVLSHGHGGSGTDGTEVRSVTLEEAMLATGFTATRGTDAAGGSLAFWGRAGLSGFDGREGTFSLDGEAATAMLGADYARGRWLAGLIVMQSSGEGGYADSGTGSVRCPQELDAGARTVLCGGAVREGDGDVEASLTSAVPWAAYRASERIRLWGALGRGTGEVTLEPETGGGPLAAGLSWSMAAAGLRGDLRAPSGAFPALAVTADALATRTSSDATDGLAASESDTSRLRVGIEGSWDLALGDGGRLRPRLEIGARRDGGDAETGLGIELGGGVSWTDPGLGLSLDLSGRRLLMHDDGDLGDRGVSLSVTFDPDPATDRGPTISMKQDLGGAASGGIDALFVHDSLEDRAGGDSGVRRTVEAAWGLPAFGGRFTGSPHAGLSTAGDARDWTLGWRLEPEGERPGTPDLTFGTVAVRREGGDGQATHSVGVEAGIRW